MTAQESQEQLSRPGATTLVVAPFAQSLVVSLTIPLSILALALFLRLYNLELVGWVPDTYERIRATQRLLGGDFPLSHIDPPGVAVILAPFFAVLPQTQGTMQAVTVAASLAIVLLAYVGAARLTGDKASAALLAFILTISPFFVNSARTGLNDTLVVLLLGWSILLMPSGRTRRILPFIAYGSLLALLINIRLTNFVAVPALFIYWVYAREASFGLWAIGKSVASQGFIITAVTFLIWCVASALFAGWFGNAAGVSPTSESLGHNLVYYPLIIMGGVLAAPFFLPLAAAGAFRLWRLDRGLAIAVIMILVAWPLPFLPFSFAIARYVLPAQMLFLFLAALGPRELFRLAESLRPPTSQGVRGLTSICLVVGAAVFALSTTIILQGWPTVAAQADSGIAHEFEPTLASLDGNPLVVTAVARAFDAMPRQLDYLDLIDERVAHGDSLESRSQVEEAIRMALSDGRPVYYLYSHWEEGADSQGDGGHEGYHRYFETVEASFRLTEVVRSSELRLGRHPWILFRVEER